MFQKQETTREATPVVDLLNLQEVDVGKTVVFEAKRGSCSREIPALIKQRFPFACWIRLLGVGKDFLCAFSNSQPSRSIRYRIEAQVIRWSGWLVLFALGSTILAKTLTESYNPAYEAHLSALRRAKRDKVLKAKQTPRLTVNDSVAGAFPLHVDDDCDSEEYLETLRYEDDIRSRRRGSTVIDALPRGQRRPVHVRPTRYELQQQYAICWEIYNRRAPPERPQRPKVLPMRF
uniref:WGS project CAEQ00000000 data, annotated contig 752 n=1 Tax=Trypanosoma congolense (strain IL3000) TaxID=1068625 RepID=F9WI96_TRYCI|nr:unnamed protein product [Trypanosoma congolense IL3000]